MQLDPTTWAIDFRGFNPIPWKATGGTGKFKDPGLRNYQDALAAEFASRYPDWTPISEPLTLDMLFWRSTSGGRPADRINLGKACEDALQGRTFDQKAGTYKIDKAGHGLYVNDVLVKGGDVRIVEQDPGVEPRIVLVASIGVPDFFHHPRARAVDLLPLVVEAEDKPELFRDDEEQF